MRAYSVDTNGIVTEGIPLYKGKIIVGKPKDEEHKNSQLVEVPVAGSEKAGKVYHVDFVPGQSLGSSLLKLSEKTESDVGQVLLHIHGDPMEVIRDEKKSILAAHFTFSKGVNYLASGYIGHDDMGVSQELLVIVPVGSEISAFYLEGKEEKQIYDFWICVESSDLVYRESLSARQTRMAIRDLASGSIKWIHDKPLKTFTITHRGQLLEGITLRLNRLSGGTYRPFQTEPKQKFMFLPVSFPAHGCYGAKVVVAQGILHMVVNSEEEPDTENCLLLVHQRISLPGVDHHYPEAFAIDWDRVIAEVGVDRIKALSRVTGEFQVQIDDSVLVITDIFDLVVVPIDLPQKLVNNFRPYWRCGQLVSTNGVDLQPRKEFVPVHPRCPCSGSDCLDTNKLGCPECKNVFCGRCGLKGGLEGTGKQAICPHCKSKFDLPDPS